jgi:hypothetical protein
MRRLQEQMLDAYGETLVTKFEEQGHKCLAALFYIYDNAGRHLSRPLMENESCMEVTALMGQSAELGTSLHQRVSPTSRL